MSCRVVSRVRQHGSAGRDLLGLYGAAESVKFCGNAVKRAPCNEPLPLYCKWIRIGKLCLAAVGMIALGEPQHIVILIAVLLPVFVGEAGQQAGIEIVIAADYVMHNR